MGGAYRVRRRHNEYLQNLVRHLRRRRMSESNIKMGTGGIGWENEDWISPS